MCYIHLSIPVPFECQITCDELEKEQEDGYFEVEEDEDSDEWSRFVFGERIELEISYRGRGNSPVLACIYIRSSWLRYELPLY